MTLIINVQNIETKDKDRGSWVMLPLVLLGCRGASLTSPLSDPTSLIWYIGLRVWRVGNSSRVYSCAMPLAAHTVKESPVFIGKMAGSCEEATRQYRHLGFNLVVVEGLWFGFFLQMGFTLILATLDGLDVGLLGDVIGGDDCDDDE
ncbi:hypothetical protein Tco_0905446 [Tanacetum coccineum]